MQYKKKGSKAIIGRLPEATKPLKATVKREKSAMGKSAIALKASMKKMLDMEMGKVNRSIHARVTRTQVKMKKSYYHWISMYRMFLDPDISSNIMAIILPRVKAFLDEYPRVTEERWFILFFLWHTPYATVKEIKGALKQRWPDRKFGVQIVTKLYRDGLVDRKTTTYYKDNFKYFYLISLKGKEVIENICGKDLAKEVLSYVKHKHDHLKKLRTPAKRENALKTWDWMDVPNVTAAQKQFYIDNKEHLTEKAIKPRQFKENGGYAKWKADLVAAGKWQNRGRKR